MASRFKVIDAPTLAPAIDYVTGTAVGPFIDTERDIVDQAGRILGRIYLSKDTVREMAQELGLIGGHADKASIDEAYHRGKLDSLKEELGGDIHAVSATLGRWLSYINTDLDADSGEGSER